MLSGLLETHLLLDVCLTRWFGIRIDFEASYEERSFYLSVDVRAIASFGFCIGSSGPTLSLWAGDWLFSPFGRIDDEVEAS